MYNTFKVYWFNIQEFTVYLCESEDLDSMQENYVKKSSIQSKCIVPGI